MTLQEFYEKYPRKYFYRISPDEITVFAYETLSGRLAFAYGVINPFNFAFMRNDH